MHTRRMSTSVPASCGAPISFSMVQTWGVASARHTSGCVVYDASNPQLHDGDKVEGKLISSTSTSSGPTQNNSDECLVQTEYLFDVPIGPSVVRWDFRTKKRVVQFQAHFDAVTSMRMSPDRTYIATSCYSGEVKLWTPQWVCLDHVTAPMTSQHHLAWSQDSRRFVIVGNGYNSSVVMYDITCGNRDKKNPPKLRQAWRVRAGHPFSSPDDPFSCHHNNSKARDKTDAKDCSPRDTLTMSTVNSGHKDSGLDYQYGDAFYMAEINPSGNVFAVEERPQKCTLAQLYSPDGELLKTSELSIPTMDYKTAGNEGSAATDSGGISAVQTLLISTYKDGSYALVVQGGYVIFVDAEQLTVCNSFKVGYSSRTCVWDGDTLVLPSDSGELVWWSQNGDKCASFAVGSSDYVVRLEWSVSGRALWMCGFSSMTCLDVRKSVNGAIEEVKQCYVIPSHSIACCGVGFSPDGRSLASGDLAGNIWITEKEFYTPRHTATVELTLTISVLAPTM